jgi:hypothetical protein
MSSTEITVLAHGQLGSRENRVMSYNDEHRELVAVWRSLNGIMDGLRQRLRWGDTEYADVADMADRVRGLSIHLDSAVELADQFRYESALALLRTGLEQCLVDWLVFLGRTMVQRITGVDDAKWDEWKAARAAGADWTTTIRHWTRDRSGVRIVREGLFSEPDEHGNRTQISIYYFLLEQYRPTLGPPSAPGEEWAISQDELRRMAGENRALWHVYLTWPSLLTNLQENALVDDVDAGRLTAHYRFLSGYAHPVTDQRRNIYGNQALLGWPKYDHYSSELVLLYAITLGSLELRHFIQSIERRTGPHLADTDAVAQVLEAAESATSYFWFLGAHPYAYDTWKAHNEACSRAFRAGGTPELTPEPGPDDVPYPADPLRRLASMHSTTVEFTTGFAFVSPWPRDDARLR